MRKGYTWLPGEPDYPRHTPPGTALPSSASSADVPTPTSQRAGEVDRGSEGAEEWLFVRGKESIRMTKDPSTRTLLVFGPRSVQKSHEFDSAASLEEFRQSYEQRVLSNGFVLLDVAERRLYGHS